MHVVEQKLAKAETVPSSSPYHFSAEKTVFIIPLVSYLDESRVNLKCVIVGTNVQ